MFSAWRACAARQLERRMQAEQQQKVMRAQVAGKARLLHQMTLLLEERLHSNRQDVTISIEMISGAGDSALFKRMLVELDVAYLRTDDMLNLLELKSVKPALYNLTRKDKDGVLYYDGADRIVFPYSFAQTVDGLSTVIMSSPDVDYTTVKVEDLKGTLKIKYQVKYQLSKTENVSFRVHGTAKKWREKHRLVFLWQCYTEGLGEFEGFHSNETTWMATRPLVEKTKEQRPKL
ncbi:hypothetical protein GN244_ATG09276 [Phytophthora infestans]|uniref:M96 mating-specific protein family n=1 Tax=Phytophthora infestans TaxID=4787 RepID=A0A833W1L3_PHYIN|nr:hypothetical protein GN244_ATG09276 [Phytophthora infestans]